MRVNSRAYWNERFRGDWDALGGEDQSRFFASVALDAMPKWFRTRVTQGRMTLCDWGCAEGSGTRVLADALGLETAGFDFSPEAIAMARARHPGIDFAAEDMFAPPTDRRFDIVFSSNTLEHFRTPWAAFDGMASCADRYVVLLLPWRERELHPEHFVRFEPAVLPATHRGWYLVHAAVIDASAIPASLWLGEQILCIYATATEFAAAAPTLADYRVEGREPAAANPVRLRVVEPDANLQRAALLQARKDLLQARISLVEAGARADAATKRADEAEAWLALREGALSDLQSQQPRLLQDAADIARVRASPWWRYSAPLRWVRRALTRRVPWRRTSAPIPDVAPSARPPLAAAAPGKADVFVWAVIDWHFRIQRPQHLARAVAAHGHRVFYVSNDSIDDPTPGFAIESLDASGRLFRVRLHVAGAPPIYHAMPTPAQAEALRASVAKLVAWTGTIAGVSVVQHPFWSDAATWIPNAHCVYDCMDHHAGFEDNMGEVLEAEARLVERADLVVVSSSWLEAYVAPRARRTAMVRNACAFEDFATPPADVFRDPDGRKVIGYVGAIAPWFDIELLAAVAQAHPEARVVLVGADTTGASARLAAIPNIEFVGEVPYGRLPFWVHGFDACLLPFRVLPLTLATNPVKVYEYLAAGKPVVGTALPEMAQFGDLVRTATGVDAFIAAVGDALQAPPAPAAVQAMQAFASRQTWSHRGAALLEAFRQIRSPRVSIVVLAFNHVDLTLACLDSLERHSDYAELDIIVVDNGSTDGTAQAIAAWEAEPSAAGHSRRAVYSARNLGFAAGNNIGLSVATGDYLVLLNNDTQVTPGWVRTLVAHLRRDPALGLVGPVTNNIGNEARIDIAYRDMPGMIDRAGDYTRSRAGRLFPIDTLAFFCVAMPRGVYDAVGGLDSQFGLGFFEDDDYCRRVAAAGWSIGCAEDVFVHHELSASFDRLPAAERAALFERNRARYEAKWGPWTPHRGRP